MPAVFQSGHHELKLLSEAPSLQRLLNYFNTRTAEWPHSTKDMECFTVGVFYDLSSTFQKADAFDLMKIATQFPWNDLPDFRFLLAIDLLTELALASETTEVPKSLADIWDQLERRISVLAPKYPAWLLLVQHYRIES